MALHHIVAGLALAAVGSAQAATVLSESFDNVLGLAGSGWVFVNNSSTPLGQTWAQGNSAIFPAATGAASSFAAANFASSGSIAGAVSNWLITPLLALDGTSTVTFQVRNAGDDFLDTLELRVATNGGSSAGTTTTSVGDFTTLVGSFASSTAPGGWITLSYATLGITSPANVRLAFRYVVGNVSTAGNYLGIDNLSVTAAVPEPATWAMLGVGVAGLLLRRRFSA